MNSPRRIIPASLLALATVMTGPAMADASEAARIKELERKLERSMEMIEQLSSKISRIEQANTSARDNPSATQVAKIDALEKHVAEIGGSLSRRSGDDGLAVHGFADVSIGKSNENNVTFKGRKGAALGNFDLYLTPQFGDRVKALVELNFENDNDGNIGTDLERMQIGYTFNDLATAWFGRFHTPYGYWNTAFHHGAQIQTSVLRPRFLDFEDRGGILPAHTTGAWLTGTLGTSNGRVGYDAYLGNAPQINGTGIGSALSASNPGGFSNVANLGTYAGSGTLNMRQAGSTSNRSSIGFNTWIEPRAIDGLRLGVHGLRANVLDDTANGNLTRLNMIGGYFAYQAEPWEALGEYYKFRNQDLSGSTGSHDSWAGYAQLGYTQGKWTPYVRAERTKLDQTDNYFGVQANGRSYKRIATGLRYDVDPKAAIKLELNSTRKEDLGPNLSNKYPELRIQYAIRF